MSSKLDFIGKIKIPLPVEKHPTNWAMERYFNFYDNELKPIIAQYSLQKPDGMHGLDTHTDAVVFRGIDYAIHMGLNHYQLFLHVVSTIWHVQMMNQILNTAKMLLCWA